MTVRDLDRFCETWDERVSVGGVELRLLSPSDAKESPTDPPLPDPKRWPGVFVFVWRFFFGAPEARLDGAQETVVVRRWVSDIVHPDDAVKLETLGMAQLIVVSQHYKGLVQAWTVRVANAAASAAESAPSREDALSDAERLMGRGASGRGGSGRGESDRGESGHGSLTATRRGVLTPIVAGEPLPAVLGGKPWGRLAAQSRDDEGAAS
jgi:hypothetical protein